ADTAVYYCARD
nr:immunoglobulin heavy chain junction region [Homo sapiens]